MLVLGAGGMLGHKACQVLSSRAEVWGTVRGDAASLPREILPPERVAAGVDVRDVRALTRVFAKVRPHVVLNCVGIVKQRALAQDPVESLRINALLPHELADLCAATGTRLVHVSTDCVFSGRRGHYREDDPTDAEDLYGRTKALGEVARPGVLTLRTSIVGRELSTFAGLVEWFLSQRGRRVNGHAQVPYNGVTTLVLSRAVADVLDRPDLSGLYQVASEPISKHDLLHLLRKAYDLPIEIGSVDEPRIDRTLDGRRFAEVASFKAPSWAVMVEEMAADPTPYERWRTPLAS